MGFNSVFKGLRPILALHPPLSPLTHHRDNVTAPHRRPNLRSRLHSCHAQEGGPRSPQKDMWWHWEEKHSKYCPKIRPVGIALFLAHTEMDRRTEVTRLKVAFLRTFFVFPTRQQTLYGSDNIHFVVLTFVTSLNYEVIIFHWPMTTQ